MVNRGGKVALCVAEKPSVAKAIAEMLAQGRVNKVSSSLYRSNTFSVLTVHG